MIVGVHIEQVRPAFVKRIPVLMVANLPCRRLCDYPVHEQKHCFAVDGYFADCIPAVERFFGVPLVPIELIVELGVH